MDFFVGTYSRTVFDVEGHGEGIYSLSFDPTDGAFGTPRLVAECANPSALVLTPDGATLFASRELFADDNPALLSFRVASATELNKISQLELAGELPCHLAFDPHKGRLASAQYWTGDVAVCDVIDGEIKSSPVYLTRTGTGPNAGRQEGPHAHCVAFSDEGTVLHMADLGIDGIVSHRLDGDGNPVDVQTVQLSPGAGPRHLVLNEYASRAFVLCELDETLVTLDRSGLGWKVANVQPGFAPPQGEDGSAAAIRMSPDGRHVYISGRRQSRIAGFAVGDALTPLGEVDCIGKTPRDFIVTSDGNWLIVAHQDSNTIMSMRRDRETGKLSPTEHICSIGSPVALAELPR